MHQTSDNGIGYKECYLVSDTPTLISRYCDTLFIFMNVYELPHTKHIVLQLTNTIYFMTASSSSSHDVCMCIKGHFFLYKNVLFLLEELNYFIVTRMCHIET